MLKKLVRLVIVLGGFCAFPGCAGNLPSSEYRVWQEEVKLNDGRVIVVTQKKRCQGAYTGGNYARCIAREAWLMINLPEFGAQPIVWHENLTPRILNVHNGHLYVVGWPPTGYEFDLYGKPRPPYIGFVFVDKQWKRIAFEEIPVAIYDVNMLIESIPPEDMKFLTLQKKESKEMNGDSAYQKDQKRIDPAYKSNF
ncbi:MAG: hypothetical protein EPO06_07810 [Burkholderiaceae bacterium]|nr:MAG: hypothetical protein EPO06_07810 [Burkholderiaceae bacterium]